MSLFCLGSLNLDRVVRVERIVAPGETLAGARYTVFAGGKGANQSVALARAGAQVRHIGRVGEDGRWLIERLASEGIDTRHIVVGDTPSGQAFIQVDAAGQNAIVVIAGANAEITPDQIDAALSEASPGDWLLTQNETSGVSHAIRAAKRRGLQVALNPAPCNAAVQDYPLELVDLVCLNETELASLTGCSDIETAARALRQPSPQTEILLTLGDRGARLLAEGQDLHEPALAVQAVDTTAAGDTFLGYYLADRIAGSSRPEALRTATRAAARCITRSGAQESIPRRAEVVADFA